MEVKKSAKADLQGKKFMFSQIGLIVALLALYGAFNMHSSNIELQAVQATEEPAVMEAPPITRPEDETPKPRVQKVVAPTISEKFEVVENTVEIENTDMFNPETDEDTPNYAGLPTGVPVDGDILDEDIPVFKAEINPDFMGAGAKSNDEFRKWVQKTVKYPQIAADNGVSGAVSLKFVIGQDGKLRDITVINSPDSFLSEEVIRVLKSSPAWTPGKQREKPVSVIGTIRIVFNL